MSKVKIIFGLSVWVTILPYLGFPYSLKNVLFSVTGLGLIYLTYMLYKDFKAGETAEKTFDNFSENNNFKENQIKPQEPADLNKEQF
ncbi:MAG: hypothetical protein UR70_C0014G0015 [Candidatus Nomurabacteria bacterium GW2011_GWB1_35_20]|nr:MAG: hypothetical protein UR70_C0014G0015 [Candidatus Nomurabacteria bacterium GW2011_GWB1_35_20]KKP76461.1 MAG: hypothetical protein UR72_C0002G0107 [Parcubacteria group bacterium GW2011_GWC1_35_21]KKP78158.1 MAG: hypothetical protein UR77_C0006G0030 [Candidatus Nomurabacteria bacterium GW2011_GWC2_35_35]KKP97548.1 MAG: hypothetical protein US05_C0015G0034 [Candidatus Nomurabacteria bacterium GW2011_GWA1_36_15]HCY17816.1 hypothetical protein [Candidatus Nomurabacteria bacterium]